MISIENRGSVIYLFERDSNNNPIINKVDNFKPYFFVEDEKGEYVSIDEKRLKKIIVSSPSDVNIERVKHLKHYEADIRYVNRFLIDHPEVIKREEVIRKCYLDIEIKRTEKGYESPMIASNPILCIGCYDNFEKEYRQFVIDNFDSEEEMLKEFVSYIQIKNPDMLISWFGDIFDFPFILNRMKRLKINPDLIARRGNGFNGICKCEYKYGVEIGGRITFDLVEAYKKFNSGQGRESFSLDYISKYEGIGEKVKYRGNLDDLYNEDKKKFLEYNLKDVELMILLDEKLRLVEFFNELRLLVGCRFEDVFMNSKMADVLCLRYAKEHNFVLPSVNKENESERFEGAFVMTSIPGMHKNVACFDMKSLYPSIMIGFNTSPETTLDNYEDGCINIDNKFFFKKEIGIVPAIVKPLLDRRKVVNKEKEEVDKLYGRDSREYKTLHMTQYTLKTIANSFYGVLGYDNFRLYKRKTAESIPYIAQRIIKEVHRWFHEKGFKIIYGDTDSCYIEMGTTSINQFIILNNEINDYFKEYFKQFGVEEKNNIFKLEFEMVLKTICFKQKENKKGVKKRYFGRIIWEDGKDVDKLLVVGFESKRSDTPEMGRVFLKKLYKMISYEKSQEEITKFIEEEKVKIRNEYTPEQIGIPIGISKPLHKYGNQIHARAARVANQKHNAQIQQGDKIKYLYVRTPERVVGFKSDGFMPDGYQINYDMMVRRIVNLKVGPLFDSLGWKHNYSIKKAKKKGKKDLLKYKLKQKELW